MTYRINYYAVSPKLMTILLRQERCLQQQFSLSPTLTIAIWELVKLRVSQINQCAFCIDMHSKDALKQGELVERLIGLSAWQDMPLYTEAEQSALHWAECITSGLSVPDRLYQSTVGIFGEPGLVDLTLAVNAINSWNRIAKAFKPEVGSYKPS
ncbi:alkylhydroperoxidase AhpD family core domain protein [Moritella sp. PE36]|uniref:carboxymuconolactone decarboxylase family protein n=1 Tax=Moritella sp. PE36 TaxID=58051 RepID=UPI00015688A4|nr:carboxymuconolactone decarboxylase family protein [Moritella sp. PE36]EDM68448.1 alkylhydroperoxidase AhpD family core domain protein [Moritella sp. PE36]